jgi:hypothetical protein
MLEPRKSVEAARLLVYIRGGGGFEGGRCTDYPDIIHSVLSPSSEFHRYNLKLGLEHLISFSF